MPLWVKALYVVGINEIIITIKC